MPILSKATVFARKMSKKYRYLHILIFFLFFKRIFYKLYLQTVVNMLK